MDVPLQASSLAEIQSQGGFRYRLSPSDVLWAARMAVYEGGKSAADVLWTVTQRFVWLAEVRQVRYSSFAELAQAFSQPINPKWRAEGLFCSPGGKYDDSEWCDPAKEARRERAARATWTELKKEGPRQVADTLKWAQAKLPNPVPRATNFSVRSVAENYVRKTPGAMIILDAGNSFIAEPGTQSWSPDYVVMRTSGSTAAARPSGLLSALYKGMTEWWRLT